MDYLVSTISADGKFPGPRRNYIQGIAAMAVCEAYGMTGDLELREPAQRAIDHMLKVQNGGDDPYRGGGWDYDSATGRNDMSVTGWCVMALKSAKLSGLDIGAGMDKAKNLFERAWTVANQEAGLNPSDPYRYFGLSVYLLR